ncbi:MAG: diacylglycerol/lipid kinase family protein [Anaerolineales bacterium]
MTARIILNPYAGRGRALRLQGSMEKALIEAGVPFELVETQGSLDAIEMAKKSARAGFSPIIAAGGDGLISEVVNGMHRANPDGPIGPLGVMPLGTANDLAINLGLPTDLTEAAAVIAGGRLRRIDLGQVEDWVFDNNSAIGLEPVVTLFNIEMVRLKGTTRYLIAALLAIRQGRSWQATLRWEEGSYQGPISLVTVGNGAVTGGLFRMAPAANPSDGLLTFVYAYAPSRLKMLSLLPRTITGSYVDDPAVHQHHTRWLEISVEPGSPLQVDGEIRGRELTTLRYSILPNRLDVFHPNP